MTRIAAIAVLAAACLVVPCTSAQPHKHSENEMRIISGPQLESATDHSAIVRWTTNIGTSTIENSTVQYGTSPKNLNLTAESPNRWNGNMPYMVHRVFLPNLQPGTTYYFRIATKPGNRPVQSENAPVKFKTPMRETYAQFQK